MKFFDKLFAYLFFGGGKKCISCNSEIFDEGDFCGDCKKKILQNQTYCSKCGMPVNAPTEYCGRCGGKETHFEFARSWFVYNESCSKILYNYKKQCIKEIGTRLAKYLFLLWESEKLSVDYVTFVPTSKRAMKMRRFDTSRHLADEFCKLSGLPLLSTLNCTAEKEQKSLSRKERFANIRGKFVAKNKEGIENKTILLIDDLITTGATAMECSRILKKCKAKAIYIFTVFSVPQMFSEN